MPAATTAPDTVLTNNFSGRPAYQSRPSRMMLSDTDCPRSGCMKINVSASAAAGSSGTSIWRSVACSIRRAASRCAPQMAKAILASSEGCMENPPKTNQPREPLATLPIPGTSTSTSRTMVNAKAGNASLRMILIGIRSAT